MISGKLVKILFTIPTVYIALIAIVYGIQRHIIYIPKPLDKEYQYRFGMSFTEINEENGLHGLLFRNNDEPSDKVVLYFHGNSRNLSWWGHLAKDFIPYGYDVFMPEYPGYGKCEGDPTEDNLYETALNAYELVSDMYPGKEIVVLGRSLGSGIASYVASNRSAKMLILETPFYDMKDMFHHHSKILYFPFEFKDRYSNYEMLSQIKIPVHIIHGDEDRVVPHASALKLKTVLKDTDSFTTIKGGKHRNFTRFPDYHKTLNKILN